MSLTFTFDSYLLVKLSKIQGQCSLWTLIQIFSRLPYTEASDNISSQRVEKRVGHASERVLTRPRLSVSDGRGTLRASKSPKAFFRADPTPKASPTASLLLRLVLLPSRTLVAYSLSWHIWSFSQPRLHMLKTCPRHTVISPIIFLKRSPFNHLICVSISSMICSMSRLRTSPWPPWFVRIFSLCTPVLVDAFIL